MKTLRIIAHFIFGISLAGTTAKIPYHWEFGNFGYWLFQLVATGVLFNLFSEFCQRENNLRILSTAQIEKSDLIKNFVGVVIGSLLLAFVPAAFPYCLAVFLAFIAYGIVQVIRKKLI